MIAGNNIVRPALIVGAVTIWGVVFFRFSGYLDDAQPPASGAASLLVDSSSFISERTEVVFRGDYRDPFEPDVGYGRRMVIEDVSPTVEPEPEVFEWPQLELRGIIGTTALILNQSDGGLRYFESGDEFDGITLLGIQSDSVTLSHGTDRLSLKVER